MDMLPSRALTDRPDTGIRYQPLCEESFSVPHPPRFSFGAFTNELMRRYYAEVHCGAVGLYAAADIALFGEALLLRDGAALQCDEIQVHRDALQVYMARYRAMSSVLRIRPVRGRCVLHAGPGHTIYGHWLVDFLPKLYVLAAFGWDLAGLD